MRGGLAILGFAVLAGCQDPDPPLRNLTVAEINERFGALPLPPHQLVDRVEARLAGTTCIGSLDGWLRQYSYAFRRAFDRNAPVRDMIDTRYIQFFYSEAMPGKGERWVTQPPSSRANATPDMKTASGRYDRTTDKVLIDFCGGPKGSKAPPLRNLAY